MLGDSPSVERAICDAVGATTSRGSTNDGKPEADEVHATHRYNDTRRRIFGTLAQDELKGG